MSDRCWNAIADYKHFKQHNFDQQPLFVSASEIKAATAHVGNQAEREVRILCKQDSREDRPKIFRDNGLFLLPTKNGHFAIVKGEGYVDIPDIQSKPGVYDSSLDFELDTATVGNSEMQHLDFAYANSLVRTFLEDPSLVLTIRGRKRTPKFLFRVNNQPLSAEGVQTEVDAGYEGKNQVVLIEAKNSTTKNTIIRQLYYPFRFWSQATKKQIITLFFEKRGKHYSIWKYAFEDVEDYNSIYLVGSASFEIKGYIPPVAPPAGVDSEAFKPVVDKVAET